MGAVPHHSHGKYVRQQTRALPLCTVVTIARGFPFLERAGQSANLGRPRLGIGAGRNAHRGWRIGRGASPWRISRPDAGQPFYCVILEGGCRIAIDGHAPIELFSGDFVLEMLLIEALRSTAETNASPGLVRGLADSRLAAAIRGMHERPTHA